MSASVWTLTNPAFRQYALSAVILALKMLTMSMLTARHRVNKKIYANAEDAKFLKGKHVLHDGDVERVRRAHQNDMENIPLFWIMGLMFLLTDPSAFTCSLCFYGFMFARIGHSVFHLNGVFPLRFLCFFFGTFVNLFMGSSVVYNLMFY